MLFYAEIFLEYASYKVIPSELKTWTFKVIPVFSNMDIRGYNYSLTKCVKVFKLLTLKLPYPTIAYWDTMLPSQK